MNATSTAAALQEISIAHSPDSDDAFMFYGLATKKVRVPGFKFTHTLTDIETLNQRAINEAFYDVTAISFHAYPYMQTGVHPDGLRRLRGRGLRPHGGRAAQVLACRQSRRRASPSPAP